MDGDRIAEPKQGRYFPHNYTYLRAQTLGFSHDEFVDRVTLRLENCDVECPSGLQLCSFLRKSYLAVFSLPAHVPTGVSRAAIDAALERFREFDRGAEAAVREQQFVVYRAYLQSPGRLRLTRHVVSAGHHSYLHFRTVAQLSKSNVAPKDQVVLDDVQIA